MTDLPSEQHLSVLCDLADIAAQESLMGFRSSLPITNKDAKKPGYFDPVTAADQNAEKAVRKAIHARFPNHGILGEEGGETKGTAPYRWVIDPIDGTRAFICGIPVWTTLIGLEENGTPIAGIIDQPFTKERWIGTVKGTAAYETQHQSGIAKCSSCDDLSMARLMVTDMRADEYLQPDEAEAIAALAARVQVTRQGLDAYGIGLVASGHMDLVIEAGLSWYDIAACMPVIKAAGGTIMTWKGGKVRSDFHRGRIIIAATEELAAQAAYHLEKVA